MPNIEQLRLVQKQINATPELHKQSQWCRIPVADIVVNPDATVTVPFDCGTAYCVAGWACELNGFDPVVSVHEVYESMLWDSDSDIATPECTDGEKTYLIEHKAQELLGLTSDQASVLFDGSNTLEDCNRYIDALCTGQWEYRF
jgi:hypothetical protein